MRKLLLLSYLFLGITFSTYSQPALEKSSLEAFMDGQIQALMKEMHINGVTISIVKDQDLFWSKGYGWADQKAGIPVDPANTLFRMGSISKTFVWTAVMQLYEQGKLDLDADIRTYIKDFELDDAYDGPITMKHLMSHTAGFEDYYLQLFSVDSIPPSSLGAELNKHMPGRVRPQGVHASYSNHGTGMAAYIVEQISGQVWEDYVQDHIFDPLGMSKTSFAYVLPEHFKNMHSKGYKYSEGIYTSGKMKGIPLAPVGIAATTAHDMAPFMIAHINNGRYKDVQLLDSATSALMQSTLHTHAEGLRGMCYGFFDHSRNGYKIVGHGGATEYFFSFMPMMPNQEVGLFISTNSVGGTRLIKKVSNAFFDRYFPNKTEAQEVEISEEELAGFAGKYLSNRRPRNRFTKIIALFNTPIEVRVKEGKLMSDGENARAWLPVGPQAFQDSRSTDRVAFEKDETGIYKYMYIDSSPHVAWERVSLIESRNFNGWVTFMGLGLGLLALIYWSISFFFKRRHGISSTGKIPLRSKLLVLGNVVILLAFALTFGQMLEEALVRDIKGSDYIPFVLSGSFVLTSLLQLVVAVTHFTKSVKLGSAIFYLIISVGMVGITLLMNYWNLIGFSLL